MEKESSLPKLVFWFDSTPRVESGSFNYVGNNWGNEVYFFCMDKMREERKKGGWVESTFEKVKVVYFSDLNDPSVFFTKFMTNNPDCIHIFNGFRSKTSFYLDMYINFYKTNHKVVIWSERPGIYGNKLKKIEKKLFLNIMYRIIYLKYNKYITVLLPLGNKGIETFGKFGWKREKMYPFMYSPQFEDDEAYEDIPREKIDKIKFLYVGRFSKSTKGIDILMGAFDKIESENWSLTLIGGYGDYKEETILWAENNENIEYKGSWKSNEITKNMKEFDVVIVPSRFDGWNVVVNESIRAGIGIIVSEEAVSDELIKKSKSGIVYYNNDINQLKDAIQGVIDNPEIVNKWKGKSRRFYNYISEETVGKYLMKIIESNFVDLKEKNIECPWQ